jgi:uncharacterized membrane protein YeaQ/YmgE (transglycosylase-associated protein family)
MTKDAVMGIFAWIVLGLGAGLLATMLIPGTRSQGLAITACHLVSGRAGHRMAHR